MDDPLCFPVNISGGLGDAAAETWAAGRQGVMNSLGRLGSFPVSHCWKVSNIGMK